MSSATGPFTTLLLDLDNTLYPAGSGLFAAIDRRINDYLSSRFSIGEEESRRRRAHFRRDHHITLVGLMAEHGVAPQDFMDFVHDVPVENLIEPDPRLAAALDSIPAPIHVFTNASLAHARRVLRRLGLEGLVAGVFDIASLGYVPKPELESFRRVVAATGADPARTVYVDDLPANLATAAALGMTTILAGSEPGGGENLRVSDTGALAELLAALPWADSPSPSPLPQWGRGCER